MIKKNTFDCKLCRSNMTIEHIVRVNEVDELTIRLCCKCDFVEGEVLNIDDSGYPIERILLSLGCNENKISQIRRKLIMTICREEDECMDFAVEIPYENIKFLWEQICQRWDKPNNKNQYKFKLEDLELIIYEKLGTRSSLGGISLRCFWPLKVLSEMGRIRFGKDIWRIQ